MSHPHDHDHSDMTPYDFCLEHNKQLIQLYYRTCEERDMLAEGLDGVRVACFRILNGKIGDVASAVQRIDEISLDALKKVNKYKEINCTPV